MRVAITGAAGFVGSAVVRACIEAGHEVHAIDNLSTGKEENLPAGTALCMQDAGFTDYSRVDAIVHCAAYADISRNWTGLHERERVWRAGPELALRVLEHAPPQCRFVFLSSACVCPDEPRETRATSFYAASKVAGEALVQAFHAAGRVRGTILRLVSAVGRNYWHGHIADFVRMARDTGTIRARDDGSQRKSFVHVDDVGSGVVKALAEWDSNFAPLWNVSSPERWSWRDTVAVMRETRPVEVIAGDGRSAWIGDPVDLNVYGYGRRSVAAGVREALVSLGWRYSVDDPGAFAHEEP